MSPPINSNVFAKVSQILRYIAQEDMGNLAPGIKAEVLIACGNGEDFHRGQVRVVLRFDQGLPYAFVLTSLRNPLPGVDHISISSERVQPI